MAADYTVTMGLPKIGLVLEPGARFVGKLFTADISIPRELLIKEHYNRYLLDHDLCRSFLPVRASESHKGTYGHVMVIGGSPGMTGAVTMAARAAVRSGAGLVTALVPANLNHIIANKLTETMSLPLPETGEGTLSLSALEPIRENVSHKVAVVGPGLSRHKETQKLVQAFVSDLPCPAVLDADALFTLGETEELREKIKKSKYPVVFTPHPGEMARLMGKSTEEVQRNRILYALLGAENWHAIFVLKGAKTLVATPEGKLYVNPTGNPGMATGGSGDVLAGMIGAFLVQGIKPEQAAALAVYLHGRAGDLAAEERSQISLAAGDLIEYLPKVFLEFEG